MISCEKGDVIKMFRIDDYIVYGLTGVCKVKGIKEECFLNYPAQSFYILSPISSPEMTIKVSVAHGNETIRMVHSKDEVNQLIQGIPDLELLWIKDDRERNQKFRCMVKQGNCSDLITIVKTIYSYRTLEDFKGTRLNKSDDGVFEIAEKLLNEELGFILDLNPEEIPNYIEQYIA